MKKLFLLVLTSILILSLNSFAQEVKSYNEQKDIIEKYLTERNEIYFKFFVSSKDIIRKLTNEISIDNVIDKVINYEVIAYANSDEMEKFRSYNINFAVMTPPSLQFPVKTSNNLDEIMNDWNVYPTYDAYVNMMNNFATTYPNICRIVNAGPTVQSRAILFVVISDSVNYRKPKPRFMYTSSMHGDETTGYVLMLRLIDTLLSGYGNNQKITDLVKNIEIWINPLANPDGTYHGGNSTVNGATRYNQNSIDLNRNFPDFRRTIGNTQVETIDMINIINSYRFTLSANFHGGTQVLNYPWDDTLQYYDPLRSFQYPADDAWFIHVSRHYVDTANAVNPSYFNVVYGYPNIPGVVLGWDWYYAEGSRQDYMTYFGRGREITMEISNTKLLPQTQLPTFWGYNFKSFLNYMKECLYGVRGIITDSVSAEPLKGRIKVLGYDKDSSVIYSDSICGDYHRMLPTGTYSIEYSSPNHYTKTITGISVKYDSTRFVDVKLRPFGTGISQTGISPYSFCLSHNYPNPFNPVTNIRYQIAKDAVVTLKVFDVLGKEIMTLVNEKQTAGDYEIKFDGSKLSSGIYFYKLVSGEFSDVKSMILIK